MSAESVDGRLVSFWHAATRLSLMVPVGWEQVDIGPVAIRFYAHPSEANQNYRSSISFTLHEPEGSGSDWLTQFAAAAGERLAATSPGYELVDEERYTSSSFADTHVRTYRWHDETSGFDFVQVQALILADPSAIYLVDAATVAPIADRYVPLFHAVIASTRILHQLR